MAKSAMSSNNCAELVHMNGEATGPGYRQRRPRKPSNNRYKWLSLLFAFLNVVWIILLIYLATTLKRPEVEEACKPTETGKTAESMCLRCSYLPQFQSQSQSQSLCCANSTQQWQNYVTAFVNVEFADSKRRTEGKAVSETSLPRNARSKRSPEEKAVSEKCPPDHPTEEAIHKLPSILVEQNGSHIVTAELTLDFLQPNRPTNVSCSIMRRRHGDAPYVLFRETVTACFLKNTTGTCMAPITMGGYSNLTECDTVYLKIEQSQELNVTTKTLTMIKL